MKQIGQINTNEIARNAAKNIVMNNIDALSATAKAIELETLKKRMMRGEVCTFIYKKKNGELRLAVGCLEPKAVQANVVGTGAPKRIYGQFAYIDCLRLQWRSFLTQNFVGIVEG